MTSVMCLSPPGPTRPHTADAAFMPLAHKIRYAAPVPKMAAAPAFHSPSSPSTLETRPHHLLGRLAVWFHVSEGGQLAALDGEVTHPEWWQSQDLNWVS